MTESNNVACEGCGAGPNAAGRKKSGIRGMGAIGWAAVVLIAGWVAGIGHALRVGTVDWLSAAVLLWLVYNFVPWWVLRWRLLIISKRGELLGFGYAFGAGIITALPASTGGFGRIIAMIGLNIVLLALPFILPFALRFLPSRPHWTDIVVTAYWMSFLWWWPLDAAIGTWEGLNLAPFVAATSLLTYFIGVRFWNRTIWELNVRRRDLGLTLAGLIAVGGVIGWEHGWANFFATFEPVPFLYSVMILGPLVAAAIFGVLQPTLAQLIREAWKDGAQPLAAVIAAALFVLFGVISGGEIGVGTVVTAVVAAGLIWRFGRLFPALLAVSLYVASQFSLGL